MLFGIVWSSVVESRAMWCSQVVRYRLKSGLLGLSIVARLRVVVWYGQVWLYAEWSDVVWPGSHRVAWLVNTAVWSNVVECRSVVWSGSQLQVMGCPGW